MVTTEASPVPWIRDDLLVVWRGMEDPPKLPSSGEDVEVDGYFPDSLSTLDFSHLPV
jgi:hypothetical protein